MSEQIDESKLSETLVLLAKEFKASGKSIDDFLKARLAKARKDGKACAETVIKTFAAIDANYADLQKAKKNGQNREEWLRDKIDDVVKDIGGDKKPEAIGQALTMATDAISHDSAGTTPPKPYSEFERTMLIQDLNKALDYSVIYERADKEIAQ